MEKQHKKSTLMNWTKEALTDHILCLEHNNNALEERNEIQYQNCLRIMKEQDIVLPCKIGDKIYKICPKCNEYHNGTCRNCAWAGCGPCSVGVGVCGDGSYNKQQLQVVEMTAPDRSITLIYDWWNIMYFIDKNSALEALAEYDKIRNISDKRERIEKYAEWYNNRKIKNPLRGENYDKRTIME